jgi:hypothetical protein
VSGYLLRVFPPLVKADSLSEAEVGQYLADIRSACRNYYRPKPQTRDLPDSWFDEDPRYLLEAIRKLKYRMLSEHASADSPYRGEKVQMVIMDEVPYYAQEVVRPKEENLELYRSPVLKTKKLFHP